MTSCEKEIQKSYDFSLQEQLTQKEVELKNNLNGTAKVLINLTDVDEINLELRSIGTTFEIADTTFSFRHILEPNSRKFKSTDFDFRNLRNRLLTNAKTNQIQENDFSHLMEAMIEDDVVLWMPYPLEWYPDDKQDLTIFPHPIDNANEGVGYRLVGGELKEVIVNEAYSDTFPVLVIAPRSLLDDACEELTNESNVEKNSDKNLLVNIGKFRTNNKFGTAFLRKYIDFDLLRVQGQLSGGDNISVSTPAKIGFRVQKKYYNRAKRGSSKNSWISINVIWDYNWKQERTEQALVLVCTSGSSSTNEVEVKVSFDSDGNLDTSLSATAKLKVKGIVVGQTTIDRDGFLLMNMNHTVMKDGWAVHSVHSSVKFTMPHSLR